MNKSFSVFAEPRKIECATCLHSLTPLITKSKKDKTKKKNQKKTNEQEEIIKEEQDITLEINKQNKKMYITYSDAVLATLNENVKESGSKLSELIEKLQTLFYFDTRNQQYIHPKTIPDSQLEFIISNNSAVSPLYKVIDGLVFQRK